MAKKRATRSTKNQLVPGENPLDNKVHELFCVLYAGVSTKEYFGNATQSYLYASGRLERIFKIEEEIAFIEAETPPPADLRVKRQEFFRKKEERIAKLKLEKKSCYRVANVDGPKLLVKTGIRDRVNYLLDRYLSDEIADREMAKVIAQDKDLHAKVAAYREIAKVKSRVRGAGHLEGEFVFEWDNGEDVKTGAKKKTLKATVKASTGEEEEGDGLEAVFGGE